MSHIGILHRTFRNYRRNIGEGGGVERVYLQVYNEPGEHGRNQAFHNVHHGLQNVRTCIPNRLGPLFRLLEDGYWKSYSQRVKNILSG